MTTSKSSKLVEALFKALTGLTLFFVQEMYRDVKELREQLPVVKAEIENLKDQRLLDKFKGIKISYPFKDEPIITYDSLIKTKNQTL